jgi:hypothetical protein
MERTADIDWIRRVQDEADKRRRDGVDPYQAQIRRHHIREGIMFAFASLAMVFAVGTFYAVLIR